MSKVDLGIICSCICHTTTSVRHILPCCRGLCKECSQHIKDFKKHKEICSNTEDPVMGLLEAYHQSMQRRKNATYLFEGPEQGQIIGFRDGYIWHYDGKIWARLKPLGRDAYQRREVKGFLEGLNV